MPRQVDGAPPYNFVVWQQRQSAALDRLAGAVERLEWGQPVNPERLDALIERAALWTEGTTEEERFQELKRRVYYWQDQEDRREIREMDRSTWICSLIVWGCMAVFTVACSMKDGRHES
jgi:hypothetical protein